MTTFEINNIENKYVKINNRKIYYKNSKELVLDNNGNIIDDHIDKKYSNNYNIRINNDNIILEYKSNEDTQLINIEGKKINYTLNQTKIYVVVTLTCDLYIQQVIENFLRQIHMNKDLIIIRNNNYITEGENIMIDNIISAKIVEDNEYINEIREDKYILVNFEEKLYYTPDYITNIIRVLKRNKVARIYKNHEIIQTDINQYIKKIKDKIILETNMFNKINKIYYNNYSIKLSTDLYNTNIVKTEVMLYNSKIDKSVFDEYQIYNKLNYYFDKIYIMNLERRKDRRIITQELLHYFNIRAEFISSFDGNKNIMDYNRDVYSKKINVGEYGYIRSMLKIFEDAKKHKYDKILVLEDDIYIHKDFNNKFNEILENDIIKKKSWDLLFLGANYNVLNLDINKQIFKIKKKITGSYALGISCKIIDEYIYYINKYDSPFDVKPYEIFMQKYKLYGIYPNLIIPDLTESDIMVRKNIKKWIKKCNWQYQNYIRKI